MNSNGLHLVRLGIDTYQDPILYMRKDCPVCRSEGFEAQARILVANGKNSIIATLNVVTGDLLKADEVGLSEVAWRLLGAKEGDTVTLSHPDPLESFSSVRSKIYGNRLSASAFDPIISDIAKGLYGDVQLSAFVTACADNRLDTEEILGLTQAMIKHGDKLSWDQKIIVDKHCVGGLPGNRTTPIIVPIVTAAGFTMPKTSSRSITSPAGTADTMETLAPVDLDVPAIKKVVEKEGGCLVWGGAVRLAPSDDLLIRVERALDLDSEGQLVASILSKKAAAGSTHVVIDMPVGATAKVRSKDQALSLTDALEKVGKAIGLSVKVVVTDGSQPVGRGIGPALEAQDVLAVLRRDKNAPQDLREKSLMLAASLLEMVECAPVGQGLLTAREILDSGEAFRKFVAICEAQGGLRSPPRARHTYDMLSWAKGIVTGIDNRRLAWLAKFAGAPQDPAAGIYIHAPIGSHVEKGEPLFTLHADHPGELAYALKFAQSHSDLFTLEKK